jgi:hypothetical protein
MSNVDAATAQSAFTEAVTNGTSESNADNAFSAKVLGNGGGCELQRYLLAMSNAAGGGGDNKSKVSKTLMEEERD